MEKIHKKGLQKPYLISVSIFLIIIESLISPSYGEEKEEIRWGISFMAGVNGRSEPDLTLLAILPRADFVLHKYLDFELEYNFSYYAIKEEKNLYLLGANANFLFKPFQWEALTPFLLGGGGLAYNNGGRMVREIGDSHVAGVLQGGAGLDFNLGKEWILRVEYRFQHISDPFAKDMGINTHNLVLGFSFR